MTLPVARGLWLTIGAALIALPALPIARWVGAPDRGPVWQPHLSTWAMGSLLVVVGGVLVGRLGTQIRPPRLPRWPFPAAGLRVALAIGLAALAGFAMRNAFAGNPHLIDEFAQLFQARVFASGRLAAPIPDSPEFFLVAQTFVVDAGWISQYPPGQAILLALGFLVRAEWLVNPLLGGIGVLLVYRIAMGMYGPKTARTAVVLWAASGWVLFMSATYMNHVGATTFALAAWALVLGTRRVTRWQAAGAGLFLAAVAATRPLDAVAAALPLGVWLLQRKRWVLGMWMTAGALPVAVVWGFVNWRTFGDPFALGYTALYGPEHGLGFHADPWGRSYTPLVGLSNLAVAVRRLHIHLFEWPVPALLPVAVWALLARRHGPSDLVLAAGVMAAPLLYFFYWHSGFYPGPRFYYVAAPFLVLATARAWRWAWARVTRLPGGFVRWDVALASAAVIVFLLSGISLMPSRWASYRTQLASLKRHPERALADAGVRQALVLVPESWGSRIVTNLWALGAPPGLVERAFRRIDACDLHLLGAEARQASLDGQHLVERLERELRETRAPVHPVANWPDPTLRMRSWDTIPEACQTEMRRDRDGIALYAPLVWRNPVGLDSGIIYARDLFEHNEVLLARYDGWPLWRYAPPAGEPNAPPVLTPLRPGDPSGPAVRTREPS
ncbi:MAG: hypothetical protein O7I93_18995 [Gemmatimonadetes bacterium]|nr:hypothetical protein [Gemmatimonadota bacterium]